MFNIVHEDLYNDCIAIKGNVLTDLKASTHMDLQYSITR